MNEEQRKIAGWTNGRLDSHEMKKKWKLRKIFQTNKNMLNTKGVENEKHMW